MASRHVDVNERRLRPVYDALDNLNNKLAIQLADKILKKQKDLHCAKVLKSLALLRSGKTSECEILMNEVKHASPADEPTLQAMTICYREMQKPEEIPLIYEAAVKQSPKSEDFLSHLFMAYVRLGEYKKQQMTAMNLYKVASKNPYYFWAVMSIVMQATSCGDEKMAKTMFLPLAERMIEKFINEGKIEAEAEVQLYLIVLEMQEKFEKALSVIRGPLGEKIVTSINEKETREAELLFKLSKMDEANQAYKKLIITSPDQWASYLMYFDTVFSLVAEGWEQDSTKESTPCVDYNVEMAENFITSLLKDELVKDKVTNRSPYLAELELIKRARQNNLPHTEQDVGALLLQYFKTFGDRACCFPDMNPYLLLLPKDKVENLLKSLEESLPALPEDASDSDKIKHLQRKLCIVQVTRFLGGHENLDQEEKMKEVKECAKEHRDGLPLGTNLLSTDFQYSDFFALLAAHLLWDLYQEKGDKKFLWQTLIVLESALKQSQSNFQFKIFLMKVYCTLGAFGPCVILYDSMDVKHIEHDTIGYLYTRFAQPLGHLQAAMSSYETMLKFFYSNQKDTPEYITNSYKFGSFHKVLEFVKFRERLDLSLQFSSVTYEKLNLEVFQRANTLAEAQTVIKEINLNDKFLSTKDWFERVVDNRDLSVTNTWDPPSKQLTSGQVQASFQLEVLWMRLRCLLLRALSMAVSQACPPSEVKSQMNGDSCSENSHSNSLTPIIEEIQLVLREAQSNEGLAMKLPIHGPPVSRFVEYFKGRHDKVLMAMLQIVASHDDGSSEERSVSDIQKHCDLIVEILQAEVRQCCDQLITEDGEKKVFNGFLLESLVLFAETFSFLILLSAVYHHILVKLSGGKKTKKKKVSKHTEEQEMFKKFLESIKALLKEINSKLEEVEMEYLSHDLMQVNLQDLHKETDSSIVTEIWDKVQQSYKQSIMEIKELLKRKTTLLNSLQL